MDTATDVSPTAELVDVEVLYGSRRVLGPLSVVLRPGQHWALLGPNGSGKTTLLGLLGSQRHPSFGTVTILGERLGATDMRVLRRRIGVVGHGVTDLLPIHVSALQIVLTGKESLFAPWWSEFDEADRQQARLLLERFHVGHLAEQKFGLCSHGERQRVLLARSMFSEHPLLLLDEPASGVDLPGREALITALEELANAAPQLCTVHVAHTLEELPRSITHALLLRNGEPVALGPVNDVLQSDRLSACYGLSFEVTRHDGRFGATARGAW